VVASYQDAAISGSTVILRPGIQSLLEDARTGRFDVVLAEALDRVSRDQADVATLHKHLQFARVPLVTLSEGEISELHVGLKGTMNALFLKDLARKTHRGQRGRIEKGFSAGAVGYGYRMVRRLTSEGELVRGEREIDEAQALIVNRIFREFAAGKSPRAIARDLNAEGIAGPSALPWSDTSIRGNVRRGSGILNNELYVGVRVWNHKHHVKDPTTGRTVERANPESEWVRVPVPHLRIVSDDLWEAVRRQQQALAAHRAASVPGNAAQNLHTARRPVHLLSGLLECGACGGKVGVITTDRYGCMNHHRRSVCDNGRTIKRQLLEQRALTGIAERLVSPGNVREAVAAYAEEVNRQNRERRIQSDADTQALTKIERAVAGIITAIEDGLYQPAMKARMAELEHQRVEIEARMEQAPAVMPDVHPGIADIYRRRVARLAETLDDPETRPEAASALRSIIGRIVLSPGDKRGEMRATLHGELMGILDFVRDTSTPTTAAPPLVMLSVASRSLG
jgi:DNA invertase Pin-like site-specific DNA recombinase